MKLTTLGCWGAYPYKDGGTTSYLVTSEDGFQLLMDCGSRAVTELEKEISPLDLDAVIISHYHPDHVADLGVLRHYFQLYPKHLWEPKILPIYGHTEDEQEFAKLTLDGVSLKGKPMMSTALRRLVHSTLPLSKPFTLFLATLFVLSNMQQGKHLFSLVIRAILKAWINLLQALTSFWQMFTFMQEMKIIQRI